MSVKCYGSTTISKIVGEGSTPSTDANKFRASLLIGLGTQIFNLFNAGSSPVWPTKFSVV